MPEIQHAQQFWECFLQLPEHSKSWSWGYKTIWVSQSHHSSICTQKHRQHSHSGIKVSPTPPSSRAGSDRNHPTGLPSPAPNTLCIMISSKENKFCISSTGQAIQGLPKVPGVWIGKHSQNQQADGLSFRFRSPPLYDCLACSASGLFTVSKLSGHILKASFGSVCDP